MTHHRREYKKRTTPASLQGNIAYTLAKIAKTQPNDVILDPFCGSGTIITEASKFYPQKLVGVDKNPIAIEISNRNSKNVENNNLEFINGDFFEQNFAPNNFTKIITNPPFNKQIKVDRENFLNKFVEKAISLLQVTGMLVMLTTDYATLMQLFHKYSSLSTNLFIDINLNGEFVYIIRAIKR